MLDPTLPFQSNFKDVRVNCRFELPTRKPYMYSTLPLHVPVCWLATVCGAFVIATYERSRIGRVQVSRGMRRYDDQLLGNLHVTRQLSIAIVRNSSVDFVANEPCIWRGDRESMLSAGVATDAPSLLTRTHFRLQAQNVRSPVGCQLGFPCACRE